jgi:hypothetical protein
MANDENDYDQGYSEQNRYAVNYDEREEDNEEEDEVPAVKKAKTDSSSFYSCV